MRYKPETLEVTENDLRQSTELKELTLLKKGVKTQNFYI